MVDYNASRLGDANAIEMGMPGQRIPSNQSSTNFSNNDAYVKDERSLDDDPNELETDYQPVNWKRVFFSKKYLPVWIVLIIVGLLTAVITLKHDQVVEALRPFAEKVRDIPAGWLIFVAVLFIISFPPLFGHELVALLAGVVYGLWIGFAVVAAGTFIGEIGTWFAFKKLFRRKAEKMERTNLTYGAMAKLCRDGGFWMVFVIRLSVVPSHMSTAVFSTCDVRFWHFAVSTFFTLPKQLILVYLGVLLVGGQSDFWVKFALFGVAGVITVASGVWIWWKMRAIKKDLITRQDAQRARQALRRNNSYNNQADMQAAGAPAMSMGGGAYANEFEREQAEVYESYRPQMAAGTTPAYYQDNDGDLGTRYQAYSPPGQAYTTSEAFRSTPTSPPILRYQASVQDSPEQTKAREPHGFI
ncbi:hypothetical protein N0V93_006495 [Gnomoniopsis smithogilvyi]|uniref:Golgi apparatus membrane protein TVP38 n=1 Tax=Gnomoniopsis smithogilvyi TaxID=1191159 RepID=A0A9W8YNC1_9PEZI|nr:hypothetical protein N0V93_006495 [Gnomoniopsis smithogilvyi]